MSFENAKQDFRNKGYKEGDSSNSGQCTSIFIKDGLIHRLGQCERYDFFANLVLNNKLPKDQVVEIYSHALPEGVIHGINSTGLEYTLTTMQILEELTSDEQKKYELWIKDIIPKINNGIQIEELEDEFHLLESIVLLRSFAIQQNFLMDFMQAKNIMKSGSKFVHIDPFG